MITEQSLCGGLVRFTAAIALLTVGTGWAIAGGSGGRGGSGGGSGGSHGGGSHGGFSGSSFGHGGYGGYGFGGYGYGRGYGGYGFGGYGFGGYGYGRGYGGYGFGGYGYSRGSYSGYGYVPGYFSGYYPFDNGYDSYYRSYAGYNGYSLLSMNGYGRSSDPSYAAQASPPPGMVGRAPAMPDTTAVIELRVPADALVWINDSKTKPTGALRRFVSPPLLPKQSGLYDIRCRWEQDGRQQEQTRQVTVRAGDRLAINFLQ